MTFSNVKSEKCKYQYTVVFIKYPEISRPYNSIFKNPVIVNTFMGNQ